MATITPTLVVSARIEGEKVHYDVYPDEFAIAAAKATRFSELAEVHTWLVQEVPTFKAQLPRKTLRIRRDDAFIESRRKAIEEYLRAIVCDPQARQSTIFRAFFGEAAPDEERLATLAKDSSLPRDINVGIVAPIPLCPLVGKELQSMVSTKQTALQDFVIERDAILRKLKEGEKAATRARLEVEAVAKKSFDAATLLDAHRAGLQDLKASLLQKRAQEEEKLALQGHVIERIKKELELVRTQTKAARDKLEQARRVFSVACERSLSDADRALADASMAEAKLATAKEIYTAMSAAKVELQHRVDARQADLAAADRELDGAEAATAALHGESADAERLLAQAEADVQPATAAVVAHADDVARRSKVREAKIRKAKEHAVDLAALRDMRSRGQLREADRAKFDELETEAGAAAACAAAMAKQEAENLIAERMSDQETAKQLQAAAVAAIQHRKNRQLIADATRARLTASRIMVQSATAKRAGAVAALDAACIGFREVQDQVDGTLAKDVEECTASFALAKDLVAALPKMAEKDQAPLKNQVEAESLIVMQLEGSEAKLLEALKATGIEPSTGEWDEGFSNEAEASQCVLEVVELELVAVKKRLQIHKDTELHTLEKMRAALDAWAEEKTQMEAELHGIVLRITSCEEDVKAASTLQKSFRT